MLKNAVSHRQRKVASLINITVIDALRRGKMLDTRLIGCPVTITKVTVSADLKIANCYFVPFNTQLSADELTQAFEKSKHVIRNVVTKEIQLKYSPELRFYYDYGFDNAASVEKALKEINY